jgi:hypothetical protein
MEGINDELALDAKITYEIEVNEKYNQYSLPLYKEMETCHKSKKKSALKIISKRTFFNIN